jgi:hypothetical protein
MKLSMLFLCIWLCVTPCQSADQISPKHVVAPIYPLLCWQARLQGTDLARRYCKRHDYHTFVGLA